MPSPVARRDGVVVDVDITPLAPPSPGVSPSPSPTSPAMPPHHDGGWLAVTGAEPAWVLIGTAAALVVAGLILIAWRRRAISRRGGRGS